MLHSVLSLRKKKHSKGPTTQMKRSERDRWVPEAQFHICWRLKAAGRGSEKKTVCTLQNQTGTKTLKRD